MKGLTSNPYEIITWQDRENTGAVGWIVIHNLINGVAGGGLFMHESASLQEVKDLAYTMSLKNSLQNPLFGGGKGGIRFDAKHAQAKSVLKRFLQDHIELIKSRWCTGGDINTTTQEITQCLNEVSDLESPFSCLADSLQENLAIQVDIARFHNNLYLSENRFFTVEQAITGYSIFKTIKTAITLKATKPKIVVQGFGKVGKAFCYYARQHYVIVGICESDWFIYEPDGIDIERLLSLDLSNNPLALQNLSLTRRCEFESAEDFLVRFLQQARADIFCPCALRYCITQKVLDILVSHTFVNLALECPFIIAGANDVFSEKELITLAFAHHITVLPEWLSNSGSAILFMEALKYQSTSHDWSTFIKQQVARRISYFITQASRIAHAHKLNIYEACCYLAQSIVQNNHHQLDKVA
jgi:glutamate dehydrogenase (NAD(P)+)